MLHKAKTSRISQFLEQSQVQCAVQDHKIPDLSALVRLIYKEPSVDIACTMSCVHACQTRLLAEAFC